MGFFDRLKSGLTKTRDNLASSMDSLFSGFSKIDDDFYEELEEILIMADIGVSTTEQILDDLRDKVKENKVKDAEACRELLKDTIKEQMAVGETAYEFEDKKSVVLMIGVNGVGKTTSVGKLASQMKGQGKRVILAAADTFRAAAIEQLTEWANRAGVEIIAGQEGGDPASVVYDAVHAAKARKADVLICDTAGRLHNKKNLMEELKKINRIIEREYPEAYRETLIVLDGTTGQNALVQAKQFAEVADISGIVLTKLDGTARGGIAIAIQSEMNIPVKYIGIGEGIDDLQRFEADQFVEALFSKYEDEDAESAEASEPDGSSGMQGDGEENASNGIESGEESAESVSDIEDIKNEDQAEDSLPGEERGGALFGDQSGTEHGDEASGRLYGEESADEASGRLYGEESADEASDRLYGEESADEADQSADGEQEEKKGFWHSLFHKSQKSDMEG